MSPCCAAFLVCSTCVVPRFFTSFSRLCRHMLLTIRFPGRERSFHQKRIRVRLHAQRLPGTSLHGLESKTRSNKLRVHRHASKLPGWLKALATGVTTWSGKKDGTAKAESTFTEKTCNVLRGLSLTPGLSQDTSMSKSRTFVANCAAPVTHTHMHQGEESVATSWHPRWQEEMPSRCWRPNWTTQSGH